jgi:hypothetical protein
LAVRIDSRDFQKLADYVKNEKERRKQKRRFREEKWKEIDRQIAMTPKPSHTRAGDNTDRAWMSAIELPWMAGALETLDADIMRIIMPAGNDWYSAHGVFTDKWADRVEKLGILPGVEGDEQGIKADQDTLDLIIKSVMDHYHAQYDSRRSWTAMTVEAVKYGTFAGRVGLLNKVTFSGDWRGMRGKGQKEPRLIPVSIKNLYLDDSLQNALHEGQVLQPTYIRTWHQKLEELENASIREGEGWIPKNLKGMTALKAPDQEGQVELMEMEGDLVVPRSGKNILLPNHIVTVAVGNNARVVRLRQQELPFRSYITGVYENDQLDDVYGSSPLTRGRPIQAAGTEVANRMINAAVLNAEPPISYDRDDTALIAAGGPVMAPGKTFESDSPDKIVIHEIGDVGTLFAMFQGLKNDFEETTRVNDPRRGGELKSHTTGFAADLAASRSLLPTEDFATEMEVGPITTWLYMHFELVKKALGGGTQIFVNTRGVKGHFEISSGHMPDKADFIAEGAKGILTKREKRETFLAYYKAILETLELKTQFGGQPPDFKELDRELAAQFGITDAERFDGKPAPSPGGVPDATGVPGDPGDFSESGTTP